MTDLAQKAKSAKIMNNKYCWVNAFHEIFFLLPFLLQLSHITQLRRPLHSETLAGDGKVVFLGIAQTGTQTEIWTLQPMD